MPHVSHKKLTQKAYKEILRQLAGIIVAAKSNAKARKLINDLFTETERTMLAKRLACIILLKKGYSFAATEKMLKLSHATVIKLWKGTKTQSFEAISSYLSKKKREQEFWETLADILLPTGMPPYGKGRWSKTLQQIDRNNKNGRWW